MRILIVEDNEDSRILLTKQLRAHGHEVMAATDGVEALQQALAEIPDILISDIMMPKMDGYQLCQQCKQNDKLRDIPFVFYTATYTKEEDEKLGLSLGANSFIRKPTEPDVLVQMLSEIVENAQSGALAPPKAPLEPSLFLSEYTKRIVAKLEDKVAELETEITERRRAEEALAESESKLSSVLSSMVDLVFVLDKDSRFTSFYVPSEELFISPEEFVGKRLSEVMPPHVNELFTEAFDKNKKGEVAEYEYWLGIDGETEWYSAKISPMLVDGEFAGCVVVARNITQRKQAEHDMGERIKELTCLYGVGQLVTKADASLEEIMKGTVELISDAWQYPEITCARITFDGKEFKTGNFAVTEWKQFSDIELKGKRVGTLEVYYLEEKAELDEGPFLKEERLLINAVTERLGRITEHKQGEQELVRLYEELKMLNLELEERVKERTSQLEEAVQVVEVASRAKSDFLASMSHELRTPLNAVIGFSQVLQEQYFGKLNEKQAEYMTDILESGQHLLSLINDILDLAKIEAGKMELELSKVIIKDLLGSSLIMIKEKALVHGISLDIDTTGDLDYLKIMVDERRLKQVMFNLLSNAAKFTPDGGSIGVEGKKEGKELIISVSDTGIGIAPEDQERVFEEFYQASGAINNKTPGTGLGLPVTRSIVEMHGGRIWVESEGPDKGSRFTFTLPI